MRTTLAVYPSDTCLGEKAMERPVGNGELLNATTGKGADSKTTEAETDWVEPWGRETVELERPSVNKSWSCSELVDVDRVLLEVVEDEPVDVELTTIVVLVVVWDVVDVLVVVDVEVVVEVVVVEEARIGRSSRTPLLGP